MASVLFSSDDLIDRCEAKVALCRIDGDVSGRIPSEFNLRRLFLREWGRLVGHLNPDLRHAMWEQGLRHAAARFPFPDGQMGREQ